MYLQMETTQGKKKHQIWIEIENQDKFRLDDSW